MALDLNKNLFIWIALIGLMLNVLLYIFTGFFAGQGIAQQVPSLTTVNQYEGNMTAASKNIGSAFSLSTFKLYTCNAGDYGCAITNLFVELGNIIWSIGGVIVNVFVLFGLGVLVIILLLVTVLPQILSSLNLGIISDILYLVDGTITVIIAYYVLPVILELGAAITGVIWGR